TSPFDSLRLLHEGEGEAQLVFLPKGSADSGEDDSAAQMLLEPTVRFEAKTCDDGIARFERLSQMRYGVQAIGPVGSRLAPNKPVTGEVGLTGLAPERISFTAEADYRVPASAILDLAQDGAR